MGVLEDPLDVPDVGVVLSSPLPETCALAHLGNAWFVIVGEDLVLKDSVGDLGSSAD
jgi:hypothetical protein